MKHEQLEPTAKVGGFRRIVFAGPYDGDLPLRSASVFEAAGRVGILFTATDHTTSIYMNPLDAEQLAVNILAQVKEHC